MSALQLHSPTVSDPSRAPAEASDRAAESLLIVNADDWGGFRAGTDAIERCFAAGAITSATAMVFMDDSRRAAEIALAGERPTGLHLNVTQPYDSAPAPARERQLRAIPHFRRLATRRWLVSPRSAVRRLIRDVIRDQLAEYEALYECAPTHLDSHQHAHVCPDVLMVLPRALPIRQTLSPLPGRNSLPREAKRAAMARRFDTTARLWCLRQLHPAFGGSGIGDALARSASCPVEVICHPSFPEELDLLLGDEWLDAMRALPAGDFRDLPRR